MSNLFFKNGKAKKKYCACLNWYRKELASLYHRDIMQCAGLRCPYYAVGCGRANIREFEDKQNECR